MASDDLKQVRELFEAALRRDPEERKSFLDEACVGQPSLRSEVAMLLAAHDRSGDASRRSTPKGSGGIAPETSADRDSGRMIGPYIIRHEIGRGGMGVVYLADDTRLSRRVALKALPPNVARAPDQRVRMRQEARAAAALSHPGIATVYAFEEIDDELYLACEYVPGQTLRAMLDSGPLPLLHVVDIGLQLARALAAAHGNGVVHRDLKPENVVRSPSGVVKVLDFGVARVDSLTPAHLTETGTLLGTPAYIAPEQAMGREVDFRADLFSFGVVIYEMAAGSNPFVGGTFAETIARILQFEPVTLSEIPAAAAGPTLDRIVATCLQKRAADRYTSTADLVADLERLRAELAEDGSRSGARRPHVAQTASAQSAVSARWWWEFHQYVMSTIYVLMNYPTWRARTWLPQPWGMLLVFVVLACAAAATCLRLHLVFTARFYPGELPAQRGRAMPLVRLLDAGFAIALVFGAVGIATAHLGFAVLMLTVAVAVAMAGFAIEPTTTRAAFKGKTGRP